MSGAEFVAVLGLTASVVQCIDAGNKVLKQLRDFQTGSIVRRDTVIQLESLVELLDKIPLEKGQDQSLSSDNENLVKLVQGCQRHIRKLNVIIEKVAPAETDSKLKRLSKGAKFLWNNGELVRWERALAEYKASLSL